MKFNYKIIAFKRIFDFRESVEWERRLHNCEEIILKYHVTKLLFKRN